MKKQFVKPEIKGIRLRENILAGSSFNGGGNINGAYVLKHKSGGVEHMCPA